eukprot:m.187091 g.187091  ORF g.187091 m.187091 type:complete len:68 (+) comp15600_c0_seq2:1601-1804(+)
MMMLFTKEYGILNGVYLHHALMTGLSVSGIMNMLQMYRIDAFFFFFFDFAIYKLNKTVRHLKEFFCL